MQKKMQGRDMKQMQAMVSAGILRILRESKLAQSVLWACPEGRFVVWVCPQKRRLSAYNPRAAI